MDDLFTTVVDDLIEQIKPICEQLDSLPLANKIVALNRLREALHEVSPFKNEPVDFVQWLPGEIVKGNDYNPNNVAPPEMRSLIHSVQVDGYTQPVVGFREEAEKVEVVDGEHRSLVPKRNKKISERIHGHLPVVVINQDRTDIRDRMASTIRHNRARGVHGILPMSDIIAVLLRNGWTDDEIADELGMDADEVLRFKQNTGIAELFRNGEYSQAWE